MLTLSYNKLGLVRHAEGFGQKMDYIYDQHDRLLKTSSGKEINTFYEYDGQGRMVKTVSSEMSAAEYTITYAPESTIESKA